MPHIRILTCILVVLAVACRPARDEVDGASSDASKACPGLAGETVRWIVPYTPGGGYDVHSRLLEPFYEEAIGAEIVIENRPGAGGRVGARVVRDADPDGRTLGIVNGPGLLIQGLLGGNADLHPLDDFTALGRISMAGPILVTARDSPYQTLEQLRAGAADGPLVFGVTDVGGTSWISLIIASELLGLELTHVSGYPGTREASLGLIRGDFDVSAFTFNSVYDRFEAGDLQPIALLTSQAGPDIPSLRDTPAVPGTHGLAAQRARELGQDPGPAVARAAALDRIFQTGRVVVAPPGMEPALAACLRSRLSEVTLDSALIASASRARRSVEFAEASTLASQLEATAAEREALTAVFGRFIDAARSGSGR